MGNKKIVSGNSENIRQNKMIEKVLKTGGFLFPETVEEVKEFDRIYGSTDVILPFELQEPIFLNSKSSEGFKSKSVKSRSENFAMAAREGTLELPKEIQQKIIEYIKKSKPKRIRNKCNKV